MYSWLSWSVSWHKVILGQDSNIFRRNSLYGRFQLSLDWFQVELDELSRFHELLFQNYPLFPLKNPNYCQKTFKKRQTFRKTRHDSFLLDSNKCRADSK